MDKNLLISCDLSWCLDLKKLKKELEKKFNKVFFEKDIKNKDSYIKVTHWIINPAPKNKISLNIIDLMPNLKKICSPSTGITHIDKKLLENKKIKIKSLKDISKKKMTKITSSSEHTFFLFLCLLRRSKNLFNANLSNWRDDLDIYRGNQAKGLKALVFGYGRIGKNLKKYLDAFGINVKFFDPKYDTNKLNSFIKKEEIITNLKRVDVVFLCFNWELSNNNFFNKKFLTNMRKDSFLINTSRGENLDQDALYELLTKGKFKGVALDVLKNEQSKNFRESKFIKLEKKINRLIITPHIAGASYQSEELAFKFSIESILK